MFDSTKNTEDKKSNSSYNQLRIWNSIMAGLHFLQAIIMIVLAKSSTQELYWNLPNPVFNPNMNTNERPRYIALAQENWIDINMGQTIALFLFISALAHLITVLPNVYPWYVKNLKSNINLIRWYEYALSSTVMILVIALLCGIRDAGILIPLLAINACMNLFGASMEYHNSTLKKLGVNQTITSTIEEEGKQALTTKEVINTYKTNWSHFIYGCFAGIIPWIILGIYFYTTFDRLGNIDELPDALKNALNTVRFVLPTLFIFFNSFALNMFLQYKKVWKWENYLFGEKIYILLSLVAKSILAWFIFFGTLR
jgi:hypothetical protein